MQQIQPKTIKMVAAAIFLLSAPASPAQNATDTIVTKTLQEIVIEAPRVIRKSDRDVYHPSKSAVGNSKNGMQLLSNLMIPSLSVSEALGTVKAAGEQVQIRINGRVSTVDDVRALLPETVRRVEWIDNPGLRYGGAAYVLDIIVSNPTAGGSLTASAEPALNTAWGFYMADAKFNSGRSQWQVGGNFKLTDRIKTHRDYTETFTRADGSSLTRDETSLGGIMNNSMVNTWASYSYIRPDTTVFMAQLGLYGNLNEKTRYNGILSLSDGSPDIDLTDSNGSDGTTPSLSLYWQHNFKNRQMLVVDFGGSLYSGHTYSDYLEKLPADASTLTDIHTDIKDRNRAYAVETDYIKSWRNARLTAGISYRANRNRSAYENLGGRVFHQRQDRVYFFAEYYRRFGKWAATAGMGAQYTLFRFRESGEGNRSWSPRPQATVTYSPDSGHSFRLSFTSWQTAPSLSETNPVPQQLDGFQWRAGNRDLKTASSYMLTLRYRFSLPRVNGSAGVRAFTSPDAITPLMAWDGDRLVTTYENSRGLRNLSFFLAPQIEIIPGWLDASGYVQWRTERMRGTGYDLRNSSWSGNASVRLSHWGFTLSGQYIRSQHDLWGEKISWGENLNIVDLSYNRGKWQFSAGVIMPFGEYDQGSRSLSRWNRNELHYRLDLRMPYIQISYNLQWGRQKQGADKLVNADAGTDRSKAGGR